MLVALRILIANSASDLEKPLIDVFYNSTCEEMGWAHVGSLGILTWCGQDYGSWDYKKPL